METTVNLNGYESEGLMGVRIEQSNMNMLSDEDHFKSDDEFVSENGNSNQANLGSDSPLTENLTAGLSVQRSRSFQSIASSTVELMDNRSKSFVDLHRMDDDAVDFSIKQHDSYSEGKISSGHRSGSSEKCSAECRSRQELGSFRGSSPEHALGPDGEGSPEHRSHSNGEYPEGGSHVVPSPEHDSDSDGRISSKTANDENRVGNPPTCNGELREELDREMVEEEEDDNIKRIKDWINQIDINYDVIVEPGESSESGSVSGPVVDKRSPIQTARVPVDPKASVGMAMAYNYISAMNPVTASAQLSNLGLVAVPILSAFAGLRELNLSGNNIFQITAGAIPKGIHVLNLSKNYISVIEGLKDLTKLRILDLSHNRISRIGHGLAACSSLRELYLAGNKISEVEGLHRLLKLKILDLRNNKLSTAKGLGQLAANYTSLEAISLDGNPAQRHVGDDHLKKYLLTLIPNLVYYNRHTVKSRGKKDAITMPSHNSRKSVGAGGSSLRSRSNSRSSTNYLLKASRSKNVQLPSSNLRFTDSSRQVSGMNPLRRIQSTSAMGE